MAEMLGPSSSSSSGKYRPIGEMYKYTYTS